MLICERFVKMLPSIRREIAIILHKKGIKKSKIAKSLGITKSAVSQYIRKKRGKKMNRRVISLLHTYDVDKRFEENICLKLCRKIKEELCRDCKDRNCKICSVKICG